MKEVRIVLDEAEYQEILKVKGEKSWKELLLSTLNVLNQNGGCQK